MTGDPCPQCKKVRSEYLQICVNCHTCYQCAGRNRVRTLPRTPRHCSCGHEVIPYGSLEYCLRFLAANPGAKLLGRSSHVLVARFPDQPFDVRLVGGSAEHPSCMQLRRSDPPVVPFTG